MNADDHDAHFEVSLSPADGFSLMDNEKPDRDIPDGDAEPNAADLSNIRIGEFLLLRRLGSGGMADVYLAEQTSLSRQVAVKVLKKDAVTGGSEVLLKRFEQEAKAAGGLSHPNLVQIITTGREGEISYIVQEYVPGLNLSQWVKKHGVPEYGMGLKWMQQVAAALRAASEAGIVHRDIKPENIMLTRNGVAKVTDFGLAQLNQPSAPRMNLTQMGTTMGTPWYMSPEQIQGDKLDYRSDQYSLGVTCYHMFAGQPPFPGKNAVTVAVQHLKELPQPLKSLRADLPIELCDVIHRMLQKKPADRFQAPADLEQALQRLNAVPVNADLSTQSGIWGMLLNAMPDIRRAAVAGIALLAFSFVAGKSLERPPKIPEQQVEKQIPQESSAIRQFAVAMLQPDNPASWKAVISSFPDTQEADLAELRLGLTLMSGLVPDFEGAREVFVGIRKKSEIIPEKSHLRLPAMLGEAYALKGMKRTPDYKSIVSEIKEILPRDSSGYVDEEQLEIDLDRAPQELKRFCNQILMAETSDQERPRP